MTTVKSVLGTLTGFLNHHVNDLHAVAKVAEGLLSALPVNQETRLNIQTLIERVTDSADNIVTSLANMGALSDTTVHISESDLAKALTGKDFEAVVSRMVGEWLATHQPKAAPVAQADQSHDTAVNKGEAIETGKDGAVVASTVAVQEGKDTAGKSATANRAK